MSREVGPLGFTLGTTSGGGDGVDRRRSRRAAGLRPLAASESAAAPPGLSPMDTQRRDVHPSSYVDSIIDSHGSLVYNPVVIQSYILDAFQSSNTAFGESINYSPSVEKCVKQTKESYSNILITLLIRSKETNIILIGLGMHKSAC